MTGRERLNLIGIGTAAAIISGAGMYYFGPSPGHPLQPIAQSEIITGSLTTGSLGPAAPKGARLQMAALEPEADRLAYAPSEPGLMRESFPPDLSSGENPDTWSAETSAGDTWSAETDTASAAKSEAPADWDTNVKKPAVAVTLSVAKPDSLPWKSAATPPLTGQPKGPSLPEATLEQRLEQISPAAKKRIKEKFESANAAWPPADIALIGLKNKKVLDLYARPAGGAWHHVHRYPVLAASGQPGPKLKQGDKQVPEGIYSVSLLNPNSRYHVSLRLNYPNDFDRQMAAKDGRKELGGDIMIHGKNVSIGCLAVGDEAAEELFVLAAETGLTHMKVIIAPADFRKDAIPERQPGQPEWLPKLYTQVASAMSEFPKPPGSGLLSFFEN